MDKNHYANHVAGSHKTFLVVCVYVCLAFSVTALVVEVPLTSPDACANHTGAMWDLTNPHNTTALPHPVSGCFPGNIYTHLVQGGILAEDPLYRFNDIAYRWVSNQTWVYNAALNLHDLLQPMLPLMLNTTTTRVELIATGVRVFSDVSLGSSSTTLVPVGSTESQFITYTWDVTSILSSSIDAVIHGDVAPEVAIQLFFNSTVLEAIQRNAAYALQPMPVDPPYMFGLPSRNFVRTEQSSFGWDWGPAFAPIGVDGSIALRITTQPVQTQAAIHVDRVWPQVFHIGGAQYDQFEVVLTWVLYADNICASQSVCSQLVVIHVVAPSLAFTSDTSIPMTVDFLPVSMGRWVATVNVTLGVRNPDLWYPRGYGSQTLHPLHGSIQLGDNPSMASTWSLPPLAIRAIALITEGNPQDGIPASPLTYAPKDVQQPSHVAQHAMFFRVNGVAVFAKGSNLIPPSAFPHPTDKERILRDLRSAMHANMNMVRVWGGGYYKEDWFYQFCDENGIMVWQEFVFACATYPVDDPFLDLVRLEVAQQVQRLSRFGSIILWSANNENDIYDIGADAAPYHLLYTETVMNTIILYDRARPLWPSSPSQGFLSGVDADGLPTGAPLVRYKNATPAGDTPRGDAHYYNYFSCPNFEAYPRTHFASEFGFQSLPWLENLAPISSEASGDWNLNSSFMNHRQHHPAGNMEIAQLVIQNFFNSSTQPDVIYHLPFPRVIFLSQLQQILCIADQASFYRRGRDYPAYRTMGTLYWQLNQNWQAPSWTSLEYGGEWKVLHYAMRDAYETYHISTFMDSESMAFAHVTNDGSASLQDVETTVSVVRYRDGAAVTLPGCDAPRKCTTYFNHTSPYSGTFVWNSSVPKMMGQVGTLCSSGPASCFVWVEVTQRGMRLASSKPLFLSTLGAIDWGNGRDDPSYPPKNLVNVTVVSVAFNEASVRVDLVADMVALYVHVRSTTFPLGEFSDNILHLIPCVGNTTTSPCVGASSVLLSFINRDGASIGDAATFQASIELSYL